MLASSRFRRKVQINLSKTAILKKIKNCFFKTNYRLMQVLSTFIKLPIVIKIFVVSILEWPFYTGFTVGVFTPK